MMRQALPKAYYFGCPRSSLNNLSLGLLFPSIPIIESLASLSRGLNFHVDMASNDKLFAYSPPIAKDKYLRKQLPPLPLEEAQNEQLDLQQLETLSASLSQTIIQLKEEKVRLQRENAALQRQVRFYYSTYEAAKDLLRSCQRSSRSVIGSVRRFRECELSAQQAWEGWDEGAKRIGCVFEPATT